MVHVADIVGGYLVCFFLSLGSPSRICNGLLIPILTGQVEREGYTRSQRVSRWAGLYFWLVMVNFTCRLGWAMVPRYMVNHYSG